LFRYSFRFLPHHDIIITGHYYSAPPPGGVQSIAISVSVCLSVCPLTYLKNHISNFVAMAQSSFDNAAICHVLPVFWMTSCFHIMGQIQIQA